MAPTNGARGRDRGPGGGVMSLHRFTFLTAEEIVSHLPADGAGVLQRHRRKLITALESRDLTDPGGARDQQSGAGRRAHHRSESALVAARAREGNRAHRGSPPPLGSPYPLGEGTPVGGLLESACAAERYGACRLTNGVDPKVPIRRGGWRCARWCATRPRPMSQAHACLVSVPHEFRSNFWHT